MPTPTKTTAIASFPLSIIVRTWQGQRASNPQPSVLETDALPIELCPCSSLDDLRHDAGANRLAALADGEPQALLHGDRGNQRHHHLHVIPRHHNLRALG